MKHARIRLSTQTHAALRFLAAGWCVSLNDAVERIVMDRLKVEAPEIMAAVSRALSVGEKGGE